MATKAHPASSHDWTDSDHGLDDDGDCSGLGEHLEDAYGKVLIGGYDHEVLQDMHREAHRPSYRTDTARGAYRYRADRAAGRVL